jgi:hypothetical protein
LDIKFIGIGGAFDIEEKESSAIFTTAEKRRLLIDCGHSSYVYLKENNLLDKLDRVFITHTHSDHISGLSTLVYDRFFVHGLTTLIECTETVAVRVKQYLDLCGHPEDMYTINIGNVYLPDESISITKIDTTANHWPINDFPNSGLLFHFDRGDDHLVVIYSGDINVPITSLMNPETYSFVYEKPENVFIFHDMTDLVHEQNPHCNFELLKPMMDTFKNVFTYHHSEAQVSNINRQSPEMAVTSLIIQGESFVIDENRDA